MSTFVDNSLDLLMYFIEIPDTKLRTELVTFCLDLDFEPPAAHFHRHTINIAATPPARFSRESGSAPETSNPLISAPKHKVTRKTATLGKKVGIGLRSARERELHSYRLAPNMVYNGHLKF